MVVNLVNPEYLVSDSVNLYWVNVQQSDGFSYPIWQVAKASGGGPTLITGGGSGTCVGSLAVDSANVYWTSGCTANGDIRSSPIGGTGGSGTEKIWTTGLNYPEVIAVDNGNLYWTEDSADGGVAKMPLDGGALTMVATQQKNAWGLAASAGDVYWTDDGAAGTVMANNGTTTSTLASGQSSPGYITVDATNVYWTDLISGSVVMALRSMVGAPIVLASGRTQPGFIATDGENVYWTEGPSGNVMKVAISGGSPPVTLASGLSNPAGIVVDSTFVYWTNNVGAGSIMRVVKN
jgi:hypothetical protein